MVKKVCILTSVHKWNDIRIFKKQAVSLAKAGFDVKYVVPTQNKGIVKGVEIISVDIPKSRLKRILKTTYLVYKEAKKINADFYHFHDPELIFYGKLLSMQGKNVIYDSHEDVPADILDKEWIKSSFLRKLVSVLYNIIEKSLSRSFFAVVSVSDNITNKFSNKKRITLSNVPLKAEFSGIGSRSSDRLEKKVVYAGGLTSVRNIKQMIMASSVFEENGIELHLFGDFDDENYKNECMKLSEWNNINYHGLKPAEEVYAFMQSCALGLVLFKDIPNHAFAIPNKAYEYMASGIPLLMSELPFWKQHFGEAAYFVNPENPTEIANKILEIFSNYNDAEKKAMDNKVLVENTMNWEEESKKLIKLYNS